LKKIIALFFFLTSLFSLEIVVDSVNDYSVLNIKDKDPFICKSKDKNTYICKFNNLPSAPVFSTKSVSFSITPFFDKNSFYLKIKVKNKSIIKAFKKNLYEGYNKRLKKLNIAKKWVIISYKNKLPLIYQKPIKGLKFPLEVDAKPFVGAIDANGNPINYDTQTADVVEYFSMLRQYKKDNLDIDRIDNFLMSYPNSLFIPDVLYLKIKLLDKESKSDEVIKEANKWIKKYAVNEHLPEVILILAKNYANNADMESATYMYERLFTEYDGTKYAYKGMIYLADELYSAGDNKRAFELYKKAFANTKDLEVASLAAYRLGQRYLTEGKVKIAVKYYKKLYEANKKFLLKDINQAYELINNLADNKEYKLAIVIGKDILNKINKESNLYEPLLYRLAKWNYKIGNFKKAMKFINKYLDESPYGEFADEMKNLKTNILFQIPDKNTTLMLKRYNEIINKYKDNELAKKALKNKIALLYKLKRYDEILDLNATDINKTIIINSAKFSVIHNLKNNCKRAIQVYKEFNVSLPKKYDKALFNCAYKIRAFNIASQIPNKYLVLNDDKIVLKWLINKAKVFEAEHNYKDLALIIDDICNLKKTNCYEFRYKQFFAYYKLNKEKEFLAIAAKFLNNDNIKNIDVFSKIVLYSQKIHNTLMTYTYAKKILELEKKYNTFEESPEIDFIFVEAAKTLNKKAEAINALKNILKLNIDEDNRAKAYYMLSSITGEKSYLKKCIKLKNSKTWMPLCKQALEVF
jgi:tetratricopeptide (TPR) repeat protein